ncbi:MAG: hydroxymethylglutaryl-CoA reductase, degradative [Candidatus Diapherotrites archaeon]|nr:hydroxymethylglutaryl-CoA reductase, degradative [Candidatus Diapherotrites archaeon]
MNSKISGLYKLNIKERQEKLIKAGFPKEEIEKINNFGSLGETASDHLIENVIGALTLPLGIATNFVINGKDYLIPMVLEEASVVAAASKAAKLSEGFTAKAEESIMIGQILLTEISDVEKTINEILKKEKELIESITNPEDIMVKLGGGAKKIKAIKLKENWIEVQLLVDCKDAMGANTVNTLCEKLAPQLEKISNGNALMRIISNLAIYRKVKAKTIWKKELIGEEAIKAIIKANEFAELSPFRGSTHNKGIMNGIDAVCIATGQDFRAIEAGAHSFACFEKKYSPLTKYYKNSEGNLVGEIELPLAIGTVGGATKINPAAQFSMKLLEINSAKELECVIACVGLAQNFAALYAITTEGIQRGHMSLHAKNIAVNAGAKEKEINLIAEKMIKEKKISEENARKILEEIREKNN